MLLHWRILPILNKSQTFPKYVSKIKYPSFHQDSHTDNQNQTNTSEITFTVYWEDDFSSYLGLNNMQYASYGKSFNNYSSIIQSWILCNSSYLHNIFTEKRWWWRRWCDFSQGFYLWRIWFQFNLQDEASLHYCNASFIMVPLPLKVLAILRFE